MAEKKRSDKIMSYNGNNLVRCGNVLYLGDLSASYFAMMQIMSTSMEKDLEVPNKVAVQIIANKPSLPPKDRVVRRAIKDDLYSALNVAHVWLQQNLEQQ